MTLRIAMIGEHPSPTAPLGSADSGGQNVYVAQVARHLARMGLQVDVYTRRDRADAPLVEDWLDGVRIVQVPAGPAEFLPKEKMLPCMDEFAAFMERFYRAGNEWDLIHANFFMSGEVARLLKRKLGTPFAVTFHALGLVRRQHQGRTDGFPLRRPAIERRVMREADAIIAECPSDLDDQVRLDGADPRKIHVVPCGFDAAEVSPVDRRFARRRIGVDLNEFVVLQLGRMVPRKGVDDVIRGFAIAAARGLRGRLLIVGGDSFVPDMTSPEPARLLGIARQSGIDDFVTFVGQRGRSAIRLYYGAADVFVTTPWYEPFGIIPLEAMACGTPVIGADVGGISDTVRHGETGFLVPPRDPAAIADELLRLYRDRDLRQVLGRQAIHWVNERFTWQRVSDELAAFFFELVPAAEPLASGPTERPLAGAPTAVLWR